MSEFTLLLLRLGLLALLWAFVFAVAGVLRRDLYGTKVAPTRRRGRGAPSSPAAAVIPAAKRRPNDPTTLTVIEGSLRGTSIPLRPQGILIGRNPECALVLDDDFASGRHLRIFEDDEGWVAEDLGSTNGTFIGAERLTDPIRVTAGTQLRIGRTIVELRK